MRSPLRITSADNPRIKAAARLTDSRRRRQTGLFLVESVRELERALAAGLTLRELYVCPELLKGSLPPSGLDVARFEVTPALVRKLAYRENPEGVVAVMEQRQWTTADLPPVRAETPDLFLIAVGLAKPGNLGAMARSAAAAGATAMLVVDGVVDLYNPNAIRTSTGAVFTLPVLSLSLDELTQLLRDRGVTMLTARPDAQAAYWDADLTRSIALVIGPEDTGLDERWRRVGATDVAIPMAPQADAGVDSLNASNAAAVLLFEALRQRRAAR